jgi:hypothetical protein
MDLEARTALQFFSETLPRARDADGLWHGFKKHSAELQSLCHACRESLRAIEEAQLSMASAAHALVVCDALFPWLQWLSERGIRLPQYKRLPLQQHLNHINDCLLQHAVPRRLRLAQT